MFPVQNNTWLFFRFSLFVEFLFFMNHLSRCFTHKRISRFCICSLKNVLHVIYCLVINVHLLSATAFIYYHLLFRLSTTFFNFFRFIFALSKKALKTKPYFVDLLLPCSATLDTIHPTPDKCQQHFSKYFRTGISTKMHNYFSRFCALLPFHNKKHAGIIPACLKSILFT